MHLKIESRQPLPTLKTHQSREIFRTFAISVVSHLKKLSSAVNGEHLGLKMSNPENPSGGVKAFGIAGRLIKRRERLLGMTDDERRWRAQWLKDQELSPEEPRFVPEYYKATTNIFRRIMNFPGNQYEMLLTPLLGKGPAHLTRLVTGSAIKILASIYILGYLFKYHSNDFSRYRSVEIFSPRGTVYPDEPDFPDFRRRTPEDYCDLGFYSSVLCVDAEPPPPPPPPPPIEIPAECVVPGSDI